MSKDYLMSKTRHDEIVKLVGSRDTVLDLGDDNDSLLTKRLREFGLRVTTIDCVGKPDIKYNLNKGLPNGLKKFDVVIAGELFEHIYYLQRLLFNIKKVIKKDGFLVCSVPNICNLRNRIKVLLGKLPSYCADADKYEIETGYTGHVRDFNVNEIKDILLANGFRIISIKCNGLYFKCHRVLPSWLCPISFSDNIIIKAEVLK